MKIAFPILLLAFATATLAQEKPRPYRLESVDLKQPVIWGAEVKLPDGTGLAFGGQDQTSEDGRPHTRILVEGKWVRIDEQLRKMNPLQPISDRIWELQNRIKDTRAHARRLYLKGLLEDKDGATRKREISSAIAEILGEGTKLSEELTREYKEDYHQEQAASARRRLSSTLSFLPRESLPMSRFFEQLGFIQRHLEFATEATSAEPPPRALVCDPKSKSQSLIYEPESKKYVLFGGDHLDYLTNDLWIFDPAIPRWEQRHTESSPSPRANHRLTAPGDGSIRMTGGYTYASNTDYLGGQYQDLNDGEWIYIVETNRWSRADGREIEDNPPRTYRTGPFAPAHFLEGVRPRC